MKIRNAIFAVVALGIVFALSSAPAHAGACVNGTVVVGTGSTPGFSCTFGGLTFGDFAALNAGGVPSPLVVAVTFTTDPTNGNVDINFNPNLTAPVQDLHFTFEVSGGINGIDLNVGGANATISETACTVDDSGGTAAGNCVASGGIQLGSTLVAASQGPNQSTSFAFTSPVFIFKDINVAAGGDLTSFTQSFHVPEPGTLTLFGSGLLGLAGLLRRKLTA